MLLRFSVKNWMSFQGAANFSMIATKKRDHIERVPKLNNYKTRVLPITGIYGANASGKTNFFNALRFAKNMVLKGTLFGFEPFRLDRQSLEHPSRFSFEVLIDEDIYAFSVTLKSNNIIEEEKLSILGKNNTKILYDRFEGKPYFHKTLEKNKILIDAFESTPDNQLFLTHSILNGIDTFRPVYNWFKDVLEVFDASSESIFYDLIFKEPNPDFLKLNQLLKQLDLGISRIEIESVPSESPEEFLPYNRLVTYHTMDDGSEVKFTMNDEPRTIISIICLLLYLIDLSKKDSKKVYFIDGISQNLHPLLIKKLLEYYLESCNPESRSQLIFTTHETQLIDPFLLRKDELWHIEKDNNGCSNLSSFSEYTHSFIDLRKSYLSCRIGGIPNVFL